MTADEFEDKLDELLDLYVSGTQKGMNIAGYAAQRQARKEIIQYAARAVSDRAALLQVLEDLLEEFKTKEMREHVGRQAEGFICRAEDAVKIVREGQEAE